MKMALPLYSFGRFLENGGEATARTAPCGAEVDDSGQLLVGRDCGVEGVDYWFSFLTWVISGFVLVSFAAESLLPQATNVAPTMTERSSFRSVISAKGF